VFKKSHQRLHSATGIGDDVLVNAAKKSALERLNLGGHDCEGSARS
jgi:hypothetical protein